MRLLAPLCAILTMLFSGCAEPPARVSYTLHTAVTRCPAPPVPELAPLDTGKRLGHPANVATLMRNIDDLAAYSAAQRAALDCYEAQTAKGER